MAENRDFFERAADEVRSWFGDENADRRRHADMRADPQGTMHYHSPEPHAGSIGGAPSPYGQAQGGSWDNERGLYGSGYGARGDRWARGPEPADRYGHQPHHDPDYRAWRERQIDSFDRDYAEYRQHRATRFGDEFNSWRTSRSTVAGAALTGEQWRTRIREHQEVLGVDGEHVGTVDEVVGDRVKLTKADMTAGGEHHYVPLSDVESVDVAVRLKYPADEARRRWQDEAGESGRF